MDKPRIGYIDGWNCAIAQNAIAHHTDHNSNPIGMYLGVLNSIRSFVDKFKLTKVFFVLDGPEAGERRRKLYPNYKGKRRVKARESKVQIMEGDDNLVYGVEGAFQNQLIQIYEFLKLLPVSVISIPYCEADDMIAYLVLKNKNDFENIIISNDRDYLQLVQENIYVYRWKAKRLYDRKVIEEEFNINPENFIFRKVLLGDTSDLIEGIKGIGEKTFKKLSHLFLDKNHKFSDIGEMIEYFDTVNLDELETRERNAIKKCLLEETKKKMILLYRIMKLDESCLLPHHIDILRQQIEEQKNKAFSRLSSKIRLQKHQFNKLYNCFNDDKWLQPFAFLKIGFDIVT